MAEQVTVEKFPVTWTSANHGVQSVEKRDGCRCFPFRPNPKDKSTDPAVGTTTVCSVAFRVPGKNVIILNVHPAVEDDTPLSADADPKLLRQLYDEIYTRRKRRGAIGDTEGYIAGTQLCNEREEAYELAGNKSAEVGKFLAPDWVKRARAYLAEPYDEAAADAAMAEQEG